MLTKFCYTTRNHLVDKKHLLVVWMAANVVPKDVQHDTFQATNPLFLIYRVLLTTKSFARPPGSLAYLMRSRGVVNVSNFWSLRGKGVDGKVVCPHASGFSWPELQVLLNAKSHIGVIRSIRGNRAGFFFVRKLIFAPRTVCHSAKIFRCLKAT